MSILEDLVPPRKLCQQIPEGAFADSALVWVTCGDIEPQYKAVDKRHFPYIPEEGALVYPAPTLAEILDALARRLVAPSLDVLITSHGLICGSVNVGRLVVAFCSPDNSATAALKLWLEVRK